MNPNLLEDALRNLALRPDLIDRIRLLLLYIQGVEVTQAIQYYEAAEHLTDPADRAPNNAVTLIAGKPAWARVYLRSGFFAQEISNVTGTIEVQRRSFGFLYHTIGTLTPQSPGVATARPNPDYATERSTLSYTLNFVIPADYMCGHLRLLVTIKAPSGLSATATVDLNVTLRQTLRLAGIMVGYNGPSATATPANPNPPNLTLAAPTLANLQTTSAWSLLTFPVQSAATYRSAGTITWNRPLDDARSCDGCCTPNWVALNSAVQAQKVADGNRTDVLYYGLLANGIPTGIIIGCESSGVSSGQNGDQVTMAHELGHQCGLSHAPCGTTSGNASFPAYEPYDPANTPRASIGEYGLDISTGNIFSPATFKDLMSYCGPRWISLYYYGLLTNNSGLDPVRSCVDYPWWRDIVAYEPNLIPEKWLPDPPPDQDWKRSVVNPEPVISIIGVLISENEIEISSVMRLEAFRDVTSGRASGLTAELLDGNGRVLARGQVHQLTSRAQCGCRCEGGEAASFPHALQAFVPNVGAGAALRIRRGEKEIWVRRAPDSEPHIETFRASLAKSRPRKGEAANDQLQAEWKIKCAGETEPEIWLQWSKDRGKTWRGLASSLRGKGASIDAAHLPAGRVQLRLLASDGFHTAVSKTIAVEIPARPPVVSILSPRDGQTLVAGNPMRLWGAVTGTDSEAGSAEGGRWLMDGKEAAAGLDAFITAPAAGEHRLTLIIGARSERAETVVKFRTVRLPRDREKEA
jgi:hypothetical protein